MSPHDSNRVLLGGDMLGIGLSTDRGTTWQCTYGLGSYEVADFTWHPTDPDVVWAGTMSGPYVSNDGGVTWEPQRTGMPAIRGWSYSAPIEQVLFDPNETDHLIAVGGSSRRWSSPGDPEWGAVWESTNGGTNWTRKTTLTATGSSTAPDADGINIVSAAYAAGSSDVLYATVDGEGFYTSVNGGANWSKSNTGLPHTEVERVLAHPTDSDIVYVSLGSDGTTPGGVYKSENGGIAWTGVNSGLDQVSGADGNHTSRYRGVALSASNPNVLVAGDSRWGSSGIFRTTDGGASWALVAENGDFDKAYPAGLEIKVAEIDPNDPDVALGAGTAYVVRTLDGGQTWEDVTSDPVPGTDGYTGQGYSGLVATNVVFNPWDPQHVILQAMDAGKLWQSKDGMVSWEHPLSDPAPWGGGRDAVFASPTEAYATCGQANFQGIGRTTDGGDTWEALYGAAHGLPDTGTGTVPGGIYALAGGGPTTVWAVVNGDLYRSTDGGDHWGVIFDPSDTLGWIAGDPSNPSTFYVSGDDEVYQTLDGTAFTGIGGPGYRGHLEVDSNGDLLLVSKPPSGNPGNGLWRYSPGVDWEQLFDEPYAVNVAVDPSDPCRLVLVTDDQPFHDVTRATGVYASLDCGLTWTAINDGLPVLRGSAIAFNPHDPSQLVLGTSGRGFFVAQLVIPEPATLSLLALGGLALLRRRRRS